MERLLPLIAERHPELAERLARMRQGSPERFHRLLADALILRLEETLAREGRGPFPPDRRPMPDPPGLPRWEGEEREAHQHQRALEREMDELHRRDEELERRSVELARRHRELRERREPELEAECDEARHHLERGVHEHFEVRTELRRIELRRVELELDRLRGMVERIREDLERREHARDVIMERRVRQLLGEDAESW